MHELLPLNLIDQLIEKKSIEISHGYIFIRYILDSQKFDYNQIDIYRFKVVLLNGKLRSIIDVDIDTIFQIISYISECNIIHDLYVNYNSEKLVNKISKTGVNLFPIINYKIYNLLEYISVNNININITKSCVECKYLEPLVKINYYNVESEILAPIFHNYDYLDNLLNNSGETFIITVNNKYIIDGCKRYIQYCIINPSSKIDIYNFAGIQDVDKLIDYLSIKDSVNNIQYAMPSKNDFFNIYNDISNQSRLLINESEYVMYNNMENLYATCSTHSTHSIHSTSSKINLLKKVMNENL